VEWLNVLLVFILILLTAFFVAAEFAIVKVRPSQIESSIAKGNKSAVYVKKVLNNLDGYLSACQLGITVTALGLGWLGEPTFVRLITPILASLHLSPAITSFLSFVIAFLLITYVHVVIGELAPKTIAIQKSEAIARFVTRPLIFFYRITFPFIWLLNGSARLFIRLFGFKPIDQTKEAHTEEELQIILSDSYKSGEINKEELTYVANIFDFDERIAKEIMIPRTDIICLYKENSFAENLTILSSGQFTRYPVVTEGKDHVLGFVHIKDIFTAQLKEENISSLKPFIRPIIHVAEWTPIREIFLTMQKEQIHLAIVNDEYGGTAGLVTVEDVLEEIVGDIRDEFDDREEHLFIEKTPNEWIVSGKFPLYELSEHLHISFPNDDVETLSGWMLRNYPNIEEASTIRYYEYSFTVIEMDEMLIKKVQVKKLPADENEYVQ